MYLYIILKIYSGLQQLGMKFDSKCNSMFYTYSNDFKKYFQRVQLIIFLQLPIICTVKNLNKQMDQSRFVSQFTTNRFQKNTPSTVSPCTYDTHHCLFCKQHLGKVSQLRKKQIVLELRNQQLKQLVNKLQRERQEIIQQKVLAYDEYTKRQQIQSFSNKQDLQAELFEAKTMLQLLLTSKSPSNTAINPLQFETLKQKYSNSLLQNLRLQQKVMIRDKIIEERGFFPIHHYDRRVIALRKGLAYWYKKAEEECATMKNRCKNLKLKLNQEVQSMRNAMNEQLDSYRNQFSSIKQNIQNPIKKVSKEQKDKKTKTSKRETGAKSLVLKMR